MSQSRRRVVAVAGGFVAFVAVAMTPFAPGVGRADPLEGVVSAEAESFAVRVEYDLPLPAGSGTIPHVVGEIRRSQAGENAKGLAAAPTHFDAVVGGRYRDPDQSQKGDERNLPQVECFYPGDLVNTRFVFPTDTQAETAGLPPTSYATARCGAGPETELHAVTGGADTAGLSTGGSTADALVRPTQGAVETLTTAKATAVSIADGAVTVGSVDVSGSSRVTGKKGGAVTGSRLALTDVNAGGVRFSVANDRLLIGTTEVPLVSEVAQSVIDAANTGLVGSGCRIDLSTSPNRYPQGFILSRKEPRVGVDNEGHFAGSYRAGMMVLCDLPESLTDAAQVGNTVFSPQRIQALIGFAYTGAAADDEPGGFNLGNLGGLGDAAGSLPGLGAVESPVAGGIVGALAPPPEPSSAAPGDVAFAVGATAGQLANVAMDPAVRWLLAVVSLAAWVWLTHLGARSLRGVFDQ